MVEFNFGVLVAVVALCTTLVLAMLEAIRRYIRSINSDIRSINSEVEDLPEQIDSETERNREHFDDKYDNFRSRIDPMLNQLNERVSDLDDRVRNIDSGFDSLQRQFDSRIAGTSQLSSQPTDENSSDSLSNKSLDYSVEDLEREGMVSVSLQPPDMFRFRSHYVDGDEESQLFEDIRQGGRETFGEDFELSFTPYTIDVSIPSSEHREVTQWINSASSQLCSEELLERTGYG